MILPRGSSESGRSSQMKSRMSLHIASLIWPTLRTTDDVRNPVRIITNVACEAWSDYSNLRGYLADRYGDPHPDVTEWLQSKGCGFVDGVPPCAACRAVAPGSGGRNLSGAR